MFKKILASTIGAVILLVILVNCSPDQPFVFTFPESLNSSQETTVNLEVKSQVSLDLDSTIGIVNQSVVSFRESSGSKVSILNSFDASLHVYDYQTGNLDKKVKFDIEGPNGIGKISNMGHFMVNADSIFLVNHWERRLYLVNAEAKVLRKYDLTIEPLEFEYYFMTSAASPVFKSDNTLLITSQSFGSKMSETFYLLELDLISGKMKWNVQGNTFLDTAFWGPLTPYTFSAAYNSKSSKLVTSMAKTPGIRVFNTTDLDSPPLEYITGSKYVKSFTSFPKKKNEPPMYGHEYREIASLTNRKALFTYITYDSFNDLYYRAMVLPRTQEEYEMRQKGFQITLIILNADFQKIGETKLPMGKYVPGLFFINQHGLHLANLDEYEKNEDKLVFDVYQPVFN